MKVKRKRSKSVDPSSARDFSIQRCIDTSQNQQITLKRQWKSSIDTSLTNGMTSIPTLRRLAHLTHSLHLSQTHPKLLPSPKELHGEPQCHTEVVQDAPQQEDGVSCGVIVCALADALLSRPTLDRHWDHIDTSKQGIRAIREKMAFIFLEGYLLKQAPKED